MISHWGQEVDVTLDSGTQRMQAREGQQHLHMDPAIFFGGMEMSHTGLGINNFNKISFLFVNTAKNAILYMNAFQSKAQLPLADRK